MEHFTQEAWLEVMFCRTAAFYHRCLHSTLLLLTTAVDCQRVTACVCRASLDLRIEKSTLKCGRQAMHQRGICG